MSDNDAQADAYYGSDNIEAKEIDLSFLDDPEDEE